MSTLSDLSSALSDAAPYAGALTALANLGIDITKLITPDTAQQNEQQRTQRLQQAADLLSALVAHPGPDNAARVAAFDDELCIASGYPLVGGISDGPAIAIGVERFLLHQSAMAELVALRTLFNQLVTGAGARQQVAATSPTAAQPVKA